MAVAPERLRLLLIGSTVVAALATVVLGVPRARAVLTPRIERVWIVSAALGDDAADVASQEVLEGTPVTLFALVEARFRWSDATTLYGTIPGVVIEPEAGVQAVSRWRDWWYGLEFLWFKVEPMHGYANPEFDPDFDPADIAYTDSYQVAWGFRPSHAADVTPAGDIFPRLGVGTMRFAARAVVRDGSGNILQQVSAPGAEAVIAARVQDRPHRVTVRAGDDGLGRLQGFAGLAYVPFPEGRPAGADVNPADRYLGGTVLAFWLRAQRAAGVFTGPLVNWDNLDEVADLVVDDMFLANDGTYYWSDDPRRAVEWGTVRAGDLVTIEDHVGVLYQDRGPGGGGDGVVNRWDEAWEAYFEPLRTTQLGEAFVSGIEVWRLREEASAPRQ